MSPQVPEFPPEIIILIINASLTPYDPFGQALDHTARYRTLRTYCLLNSIWREISQPLLNEWVMITSGKGAVELLAGARAQGGVIKGTKSMCIFADFRWNVGIVAKLLRCAKGVQNLYLYFVQVDIVDLAALQNIRRIALANVNIKCDHFRHTMELQIPLLRYLDCDSSTDIEYRANFFLTPNFLPSLRHLRLVSIEGHWDALPVIGQLSSLSTDTPRRFDFDFPDALQLLSLPLDASVRRDMISRFVSIPPFLHFAFSTPAGIVEALEEQIASKKEGLRVIFMSHGQAALEVKLKIVALAKELKDRGMRVEKGSIKFDDAVRRMEGILAKEKRAKDEAE